MAVPFRKVSKTRRDMRRTHYKITANGLVECTNCGAKIRPHRACPKCGFYKGADTSKKVVETKVTEEKAPKKAKASKKGDDLAIVEGIGPKAAEALVAAGIDTFAKLAAASAEEVKAILDASAS